jgi:hypothetical protein
MTAVPAHAAINRHPAPAATTFRIMLASNLIQPLPLSFSCQKQKETPLTASPFFHFLYS